MNSKMSTAAVILNTANDLVAFIWFTILCFLFSLLTTVHEVYSFFRLVCHLILYLPLHFWKKRWTHDIVSTFEEPRPLTMKITTYEVEVVMKQLGITPHEEPFQTSEEDCVEIGSVFEGEEPRLEEVREAFRMFDKNNDGFVDAEELKKVMSSLGLVEFSQNECERMIMVFDDDGDGRISFGEFVKLVEENVYC